MDDSTFEQWSSALLELRQSRHDAIKLQIDEHGKQYTAKDLFDHLMTSLDQIMTQWWDHEKRSWESNPPADVALGNETLKNELESVTDFEIEASMQDVETARERMNISEKEIEKGRFDIETFARDLKKNYTMKIDSLASAKKSPATASVGPGSAAIAPRTVRSHHGGSGLGLFMMFLVGLGLGASAAFYFRESGRQTEKKISGELEKVSKEKRELMSEYTTLQETYYQLAQGKLSTLPQLQRDMKPIIDEAAADKRRVEAEFSKSRENLLKKVPAGDRLDRSLEKLEAEKAARLQTIENNMNAELEPYLKQKQIHEDLMKKS